MHLTALRCTHYERLIRTVESRQQSHQKLVRDIYILYSLEYRTNKYNSYNEKQLLT